MSEVTGLLEPVKRAKRVYVLGNGGSYANSIHLCNDLLFCGVKAFTIDPATLSAFANDYGWENALERWVRIVGEPGDLLIAMSGSGKSKNILNAVQGARTIGMETYCLFGSLRGESMSKAEEAQIEVGHMLRSCLQPKSS